MCRTAQTMHRHKTYLVNRTQSESSDALSRDEEEQQGSSRLGVCRGKHFDQIFAHLGHHPGTNPTPATPATPSKYHSHSLFARALDFAHHPGHKRRLLQLSPLRSQLAVNRRLWQAGLGRGGNRCCRAVPESCWIRGLRSRDGDVLPPGSLLAGTKRGVAQQHA